MNILPKKRWHVRTKENIARVRRDEAQAAEEENDRKARIRKAETEARINLLRDRAKSKHGDSEETKTEESSESTEKLEHVNFFADLEQGKVDYSKPNQEHEKEKKEEKEKYEKQIGYLTYLGQDTDEATGRKKWYDELPRRLTDTEKHVEIETKRKSFDDPLGDIKKYLRIMGSSAGDSGSRSKISDERKKRKRETDSSDEKTNVKLKQKKHSKKSKKHSRSKEVELVSSTVKPAFDIEKLRAERLLRERAEKLKTEALLAKMRGDPVPVASKSVPKPVVKQRYHSQFFPEIARQNVERSPRR
ncbi:leukocyte receptor cluster member 1 [Cephus cinctus]|uniref:Leukocyte receptor cluster member 1 n=1 Tax=Cephus cinctus TaxID=211228 RepID=A0AAJ7FEF4_CEPCN|nr:leukocyte receptor cluster member 1 [Cephus cinctus]